MSFMPNALVGEKTEKSSAGFQDPMNFGKSGIEILDVLHHLIIDDDIECGGRERN